MRFTFLCQSQSPPNLQTGRRQSIVSAVIYFCRFSESAIHLKRKNSAPLNSRAKNGANERLPVFPMPKDYMHQGRLDDARRHDGIPLDVLRRDQLPLDQLPLNELPLDELPLGELPLDELPLDELPHDELPLDELPHDDRSEGLLSLPDVSGEELQPPDDTEEAGVQSALHIACREGDYDLIERLLADPKVVAEDLNALNNPTRGFFDGDSEIVGINTIDRATANFSTKDDTWQETESTSEAVFDKPKGQTPFMIGIRHGSRLVRMLLDAGASVNVRTPMTEQTVLHQAIVTVFCTRVSADARATEDLPKVVRLLLDAGCEIDALAGIACLLQGDCFVFSMFDCKRTISWVFFHSFSALDVDRRLRVLLATGRILSDAGANSYAPDISGGISPLDVLMTYLSEFVDKYVDEYNYRRACVPEHRSKQARCITEIGMPVVGAVRDLV